eukprot:scaffold12244_cov216-Isochrysis_galbana.AAC.8
MHCLISPSNSLANLGHSTGLRLTMWLQLSLGPSNISAEHGTAPASGGGDEFTPAGGGGDEFTPAGGGGDAITPAGGGGDATAPAGGGDAAAPAGGGGERTVVEASLKRSDSDSVKLFFRHTKPLGDALPDGLQRRSGDEPAAADVERASLVALGQPVGELAEDLAALDRASREHHVAAPRVVSAAAIVGKRATKVGDGDDHHIVPSAGGDHLVREGGERIANVADAQLGLAGVAVCVEAAPRDEEGLPIGAVTPAAGALDHLGHLVELLLKLRVAEACRDDRGVHLAGKLYRIGESALQVGSPHLAEDGGRHLADELANVGLKRSERRDLLDALGADDFGILWAALEHERLAADRVRLGFEGGARLDQSARDAADDARAARSLRVHGLHRLLLVRVREELGRPALAAGAEFVLVGDRLDHDASVRHEGELAVVVQVADGAALWVDAERVAGLRARGRVDGQQLGLVDADEAADGAILGVQIGVGRVRFAVRVRHKQVERVEPALHEEYHHRLVSRAGARAARRCKRARLAQLVDVGGVELERDGEELQSPHERRVVISCVGLGLVGGDDDVARVWRQPAGREQQAELVNHLAGPGRGGAGGALAPGGLAPRGRHEAHQRINLAGAGEVDGRLALLSIAVALRVRAKAAATRGEPTGDERAHAVEQAGNERRGAQLRLGHDHVRDARDTGRVGVRLEEVEDGRRLVRLLADAALQIVQLKLRVVVRLVAERAQQVEHLEQRLAQLAVGRVGVQDLVARLAVEQDGRGRRAQVAILARVGDAIVGAGAECGGAGGHVARRRVGGGEALNQQAAQEGRRVWVPVEVIEHRVGLMLCVSHLVQAIDQAVEVRRVAEGEARLRDADGGALVEEVADGAVVWQPKDGRFIERGVVHRGIEHVQLDAE